MNGNKKTLLAASMMAAGLVTASSGVSATPFNAINQLQAGERGAWALIESVMSLTATALQAQVSCPFSAGQLSIETDGSGNGDAFLSLGSLIWLNNSQTNNSLGSLHNVRQVGAGSIGFGYVSDFQTTPYHGFSRFGDVFYSTAKMKAGQNSFAVSWFDEHNIKNFTLNTSPLGNPWRSGLGVIFDDGKEVITKQNYPLTKWVQYSVYARNGVDYYAGTNAPLLRNIGSQPYNDVFATFKRRGGPGGFPAGASDCAVAVYGDIVNIGGIGVSSVANVVVGPPGLLGL